jgi:phosphatidylglycerophosphate synthase
MFGLYCVLCATGRTPEVEGLKHNEFFGPFLTRYICWLISPVERALVGRVSPNTITWASLLLCGAAGACVATGRLATGAWIYLLAGILDIMDGRLARAMNRQTKAGALFDSVADRWGELALLTGYAWYLRETVWLLAVMLAVAGSMMVSYTRARGEGLGLQLSGGVMQRAERIALVVVGTLLAAWLGAAPHTAHYAPVSVGWALLACGIASSLTALGRWIEGYRTLADREAGKPTKSKEPAKVPSVQVVPAALRESGEAGAAR